MYSSSVGRSVVVMAPRRVTLQAGPWENTHLQEKEERERGKRIKSLVFVPGCVYIEAIMFAKVIELLLLQGGVLC